MFGEVTEPGTSYKVDTNGGDVRLGVRVVGKTQQQARLSNTRVSDEEELEEIVVSVRVGDLVSVRQEAVGDQ